MTMTDDIKDEVLKKAPGHTIRNLALQHGMKTLPMDAVQKIMMGVTTVDEVLRVIYA